MTDAELSEIIQALLQRIVNGNRRVVALGEKARAIKGEFPPLVTPDRPRKDRN